MSRLLVALGLEDEDPGRLLERVSRITTKLHPAGGEGDRTDVRLLPGIRGGAFWAVPGEGGDAPRIGVALDGEPKVILWGVLFGRDADASALEVARVWSEGGADAVRRLNGSFSAVVIEGDGPDVHVVSDLLGCRTLRYAVTPKGTFLATHDVALVATGRVEPDIDPVTAASISSFDWSVGGHPLLAAAEIVDPRKRYRFGPDGVRTEDRLTFVDAGRGHPTVGEALLEEIYAGMEDRIRAAVGDRPIVDIDLTAGYDSRAMYMVAQRAVGGERLRACTLGGPDGVDARFARRFAARYGSGHHVDGLDDVDLETFVARIHRAAYWLNGDSSAKYELLKRPEDRAPHLSGQGGEIYRGYYYASVGRGAPLDEVTERDVDVRLYQKFRALRLPWADDELQRRLAARHTEVVSWLADGARQTSDIMDAYFAYELTGRWAAMVERDPKLAYVVCPYKDPRTITLWYARPAPIAHPGALLLEIYRHYDPASLNWLVNGRYYMPRYWEGPVAKFVRRARGVIVRQFVRRRLEKLRRTAPDRVLDVDERFTAMFRGPFAGFIRETLTAQDGVAREIHGADGVERILTEDSEDRVDHTDEIGFLLTMNVWRGLMKEAAALSSAE
jgi:hypothetical protein